MGVTVVAELFTVPAEIPDAASVRVTAEEVPVPVASPDTFRTFVAAAFVANT
jgi:hypothetical protein